MPKGDPKYVLSETLILKYPNLKDHCTKKGRLTKMKKIVILDIITDEEDKEKFKSVFEIKEKQNDAEEAEVEKEEDEEEVDEEEVEEVDEEEVEEEVDEDKGEEEEVSDKDVYIKQLQDKIKLLEARPKHGDKKLLRDLIKEDTQYEMIKASSDNLKKAKEYAQQAQDNQINDHNNIFHNKNGTIRRRYNECGNDMEERFKDSSIFRFSKAAGYPDLQTEEFYMEIKFTSYKNLESSLRTFYISTLDKIEKTLPHILICFIHKDGKLDNTRLPIVKDLYDIELTLKCEWASNNKEMYQ